MEGTTYRARIDELDRQILELFARRMAVSAEIAHYKKEKGLPVLDEGREREKLQAVAAASPEAIRGYALRLYTLMMELSRSYQQRLMDGEDEGKKRKNLVLIGMPGCGKSTLAALLSGVTGRPCADSDELVMKKAGRSIPEIMAEEGEEGFRRRETEALEELGKLSGWIIATGGGCVTREENYPLLHQNGVILWIRRDLARLPKEGRPLSEAGDLEEMARQREPLYRRFADFEINNDASPEDALRQIMEAL